MTTAAIILWVAAALMFGWAPLVLVVAWVTERLDARDESKRRAQQDREVTPEWLAVLAATEPTPIYDRLVCEQMERAEGWAS